MRRDPLQRAVAEQPVREIVCTNTLPVMAGDGDAGLRVISVAPALAEAIKRIHEGESVSALFGSG